MGHLQAKGFNVKTNSVTDNQLNEIKAKYGVPRSLHTCHTALVEGYVIEGHVPADLIYRLLKEKPAVIGLALPGMPEGSPGMEGANPEPYDILVFDRKGAVRLYARR